MTTDNFRTAINAFVLSYYGIASGRNSRNDGGPGSGNFNHKGRPGEVGGSAPDDGNEIERAFESISKRKLNNSIQSISEAFNNNKKDYETAIKEIVDILKQLEPGSTITIPERWGNKKETWRKTEYEDLWRGPGENWSDRWIADEFLQSDPADRPVISKSALSEEEKRKNNEAYKAKSWRNQRSAWADDKPLNEYNEIVVREWDAKYAGYGIQVEKDGVVYNSLGDGKWEDYKHGRVVDWRKVFNGKFRGDYFDTQFGLNGMDSYEVTRIRNTYNDLPENMKKVYENAFRKNAVTIDSDPQNVARFGKSTIHLTNGSDAETVFHEFTHAIDRYSVDKWIDGTHIEHASSYMDALVYPFSKEARSDFETMSKIVGFKTNGDGWFEKDNHMEFDFDLLKQYQDWCRTAKYVTDNSGRESYMKGFSCVSDAISGMTFDKMAGSYSEGGHSPSYWRRSFNAYNPSNQSSEYFANYCQLRIFGYKDALELLNTISPNRYKAAEIVFEEVFK